MRSWATLASAGSYGVKMGVSLHSSILSAQGVRALTQLASTQKVKLSDITKSAMSPTDSWRRRRLRSVTEKLDEPAAKRVNEFAFIIEPLKIQGATGSTVAPFAIH